MSKILFFARDPGGANCIIPIINKIYEKHSVTVLGKDTAYKRIKSSGIVVENIEELCNPNDLESIKGFLSDECFDVVVTGTSVGDYTERIIWKACEILGIPSIAIIDQWTNLGIRFSRYDYSQEDDYKSDKSFEFLPDMICVMDNLSKDMMIKEGIDEYRIAVTGQPHFDTVRANFDRIKRNSVQETIITFVSEPIYHDYDNDGKENYWGFNEFSVFRELMDILGEQDAFEKDDVSVIVRPHPRDDRRKWDEVLADVNNPKVFVDTDSSTYELLRNSGLVVGMSSMMLLEAAICDIPIMSVMIGLKRDNPFMLNNIGICPTITDRKELKRKIISFISGEYKGSYHFSYIEDATDNVIKVIEEVLRNGKTCN